MNHSKLKKLRAMAFDRQGGHCCYCGLPMVGDCPDVFCAAYQLRPDDARYLACTAEHLVARQDGGREDQSNIAAACWWCNVSRHRGKVPQTIARDAAAYWEYVVNRPLWHPVCRRA